MSDKRPYVEIPELGMKIRTLDEQLDEARARDFRLPKGSLYPDEARVPTDAEVSIGENWPTIAPSSGGAW